MQYSDAIREIKERINIVDLIKRYVDLKQSGPRWSGPCPFHQETKPSFSVNEQNGVFYCFGCQASGDIIEFYSKINGLDFKETISELALEAGITIDKSKKQGQNSQNQITKSVRMSMLKMYEISTTHFMQNLENEHGLECREYIKKRGLSDDIIKSFKIGWSQRTWQALTNNIKKLGLDEGIAIKAGLLGKSEKGSVYDRFRGRLIFPITNLSQQVIAFGGRIIDDADEAKYINSSDSPIYKKGDNLYGLHQARRPIALKGCALLTEGYLDVLTLHQYGYDNAIGVLGTALTPEQIKRLSGFTSKLILLFDGDNPGRKAAFRGCEMLLARGLSCQVVQLPDGEDIDSLLRSQGKKSFETFLENALDGLNFCINIIKESSPKEIVEWARSFIQKIEIPELISPIISNIAGYLQLSEEELRKTSYENKLKTNSRNKNNTKIAVSPQSMRDRQIMMFAVRYPHRLADLRDAGADIVLASLIAKQLWSKLTTFSLDEILQHLDEREKQFWFQCRSSEAPPLTSEDQELSFLLKELNMYYTNAHKLSISAALRENKKTGDFKSDLDYLRSLQEILGEKQ